MFEIVIVCEIIFVLAVALAAISGIAALVSYLCFYDVKRTKIYCIIAAILFGVGLIAIVPMCIAYFSLEKQFWDTIT